MVRWRSGTQTATCATGGPSIGDRFPDDFSDVDNEIRAVPRRIIRRAYFADTDAHGEEGIAAFDYTGEDHGLLAYVGRSIKIVGGADANILFSYQESLQHGRALILVPLDEGDFDAFVAAMRRHGAQNICFFAHGSMETIAGQAPPTSP